MESSGVGDLYKRLYNYFFFLKLFHPNYYFFRIEAFLDEKKGGKKKSGFSSKLLFFQNRGLFFKLVIFHCFSPNPYTRRCVSTIESLSLFREIVKNHGKLPVRSWFFGFSLIFDFSVYFNYS